MVWLMPSMTSAGLPFHRLGRPDPEPGKVGASFAPIPILRLWVSGPPNHLDLRTAYFESSCPGEQELSFFIPARLSRCGPSTRKCSIGCPHSAFLVPAPG